jgi:hypothetical protein
MSSETVVQKNSERRNRSMFTKNSRSNRNHQSVIAGLVALLTAGMIVAFALTSFPLAAHTPDEVAISDDEKCLKCHSKKLKKKMGNGERLSLHVDGPDFFDSAHSAFGCKSCHLDVTSRNHPKEKVTIASERSYSLERNQVCGSCHQTKLAQYEGSIHASMVTDGNDEAPSCTDCHSAHAVQATSVYEPVTGNACQSCHEPIFEAYATSVHGLAKSQGNTIRPDHIKAPMCADCHRAHETAAVAAGELVQSTCLSCHGEASEKHQVWLPNAGQHLAVVSCAACHSPMAERRVDLELYDKSTREPMRDGETQASFQQRISEINDSGENLDSGQLSELVNQAGQNGENTKVGLRGRMEVSSGAAAHSLAVKAEAVRDCDSCHKKGSTAFENVTVSIEGPDGRRQRVKADNEVLTSVDSMTTVGNFYALGGTRIHLLDGLLILSILGGLAIPIGHIMLGKILKKRQ